MQQKFGQNIHCNSIIYFIIPFLSQTQGSTCILVISNQSQLKINYQLEHDFMIDPYCIGIQRPSFDCCQQISSSDFGSPVQVQLLALRQRTYVSAGGSVLFLSMWDNAGERRECVKTANNHKTTTFCCVVVCMLSENGELW